MQHSSRQHRLPVMLGLAMIAGLLIAGMVASSPSRAADTATVPCTYNGPTADVWGHADPAMKLEGNLVPNFTQATGTLGFQHNPPLAVKGRVPASNATFRAKNGISRWCFSIAYQKNQPNACQGGTPAGASDVCLDARLEGVFDSAGNPSNQSFNLVARIRFTDTKFCSPSPCSGPYTNAGTGTDLDFGPVPIACAPAGTSNICQVHTSANSVVPGAVQNGFKSSIQIFRVRCTKGGAVVCQQGIAWP